MGDGDWNLAKDSTVSLPFVEIPYAARRMIVVVDDGVAEAVLGAERETQLNSIDWSLLVKWLAMTVPAFLILEIIEDLLSLRADSIPIRQTGRRELSSVVFPPGHPRDGVVYVGHPVQPTVYYTAANFHRFTFEHKFSEAIDVLMHLGATSIRVEHVRGWSREFAASLSTPLDTGEVAAGIEANKKSQTELLFEANLTGRSEPQLPSYLVWYSHEPTWQTIAKARMNFGLRNFTLTMSYDDDFGVNASLKASVAKTSFSLGGEFEDHVATAWKITGEFLSS